MFNENLMRGSLKVDKKLPRLNDVLQSIQAWWSIEQALTHEEDKPLPNLV